MSGPHLLLVDDSEAILAYERGVLGANYAIDAVTNGEEALSLARELRPAAILLDLSMPGMGGEEVLLRLKEDAALASIPVIIVSSEVGRADACMKRGAADFIPKPLRADTLRHVVGRVVAEAEERRTQGSYGVLFARAGGEALGVALEDVHAVVLQPATHRVRLECEFACTAFELRGVAVLVVDIAGRAGREHTAPVLDRKLVVVRHEPLLGACVDEVFEPELVPSAHVIRGETPSGWTSGATKAVVRSEGGLVPIVDVASLVPSDVLAAARDALRHVFRGTSIAPPP
jgi:CheY-like chemotaxis protein/chemotaxis signal transduction protein